MTNKKGRTERHDPKQNDCHHSTGNDDPLAGWYSLGKPARQQRRQKRGWNRKGGGR